MTHARTKFAAILGVLALLVTFLVTNPLAEHTKAEAANAADFRPGMLISDAAFFNGNAMSAAEVQTFLNERGRSCTSNCLKDYRVQTQNMSATARCNAYQSGGVESAAAVIAKVGQACGISQRALLVLLEKETSLVSMNGPGAWRYDRAMGYYCPDDPSNPGWCHPEYGGFFNQVYNAAAQFQRYRQNAGDYAYQAGRTNTIGYHPDSFSGRCGFQSVYIENQATAGLYIYTPYVPNQAALNNLYGTGDSCSAYGNRNFWRMYTDWFGSTSGSQSDGSPVGHLDSVTAVPGGVRVSGWTADPDAPSIGLTVVVSHSGGKTNIIANTDRPDVARVFPQYGSRHGFSHVIETPPGSQRVCVTAANTSRGSDSELGCVTVNVTSATPFGTFDSATSGVGGVQVKGWAIDPDASNPVTLTATWSGGSTTIPTGAYRPDVSRVFPGSSQYQGFDSWVSLPTGIGQVCLRVNGQGLGGNADLGCRQTRVYSHDPLGSLDNLTVRPGMLDLSGWVADPSIGVSPSQVRVTVAGNTTTVVAANSRPDVARIYPELGPNHGFSFSTRVPEGNQRVCVTAVNAGSGADRQISCRDVTVPTASPFGYFDSATAAEGGIVVRGWTWDPDASGATTLRVQVNGGSPTLFTTGVARPDVQRFYPASPANSGYAAHISAPSGWNTVCVTAVNQHSGKDVELGCKYVRAHGSNPVGHFDSATVSGGSVVVSGWVADPSTPNDPVTLQVKVGNTTSTVTANATRSDVSLQFPEFGPSHGFRATLEVPPGATQVCVTALNKGAGADALLGCKSLSR